MSISDDLEATIYVTGDSGAMHNERFDSSALGLRSIDLIPSP